MSGPSVSIGATASRDSNIANIVGGAGPYRIFSFAIGAVNRGLAAISFYIVCDIFSLFFLHTH
jgi:hypothetical protein